MDEETEETGVGLQEKLTLVLDLIKTNPGLIVDDTSVEKLLSWMEEAISDVHQRNQLLDLNILEFLSSSPESLLCNASCGNFSLRLAGIIAGCDENVCELMIKNGCLGNLFAKFGFHDGIYFKNAAVKCAFFQGFSSIVQNCVGFSWAGNIPGLVEYAVNAFTDPSYYVVKSAILFLKDLLVATDKNKTDPGTHKIKSETLKMILTETLKCKMTEKHHFLDLIYQMFEFNVALAWELIDVTGGMMSFLSNMQEKKNNTKLLQSISEVCHQIIQKGRPYPGKLHTGKNSHEIFNDMLKISIEVAKVDILQLFQHLASIIHNDESAMQMQHVPEYWNESITKFTFWSIVRKQSEISKASVALKQKFKDVISYPHPRNYISLFEELESITERKMSNKTIWKKCLTVFLDTCKSFFSKRQKEALGKQGTHLVQCYTLFLCDILEIVSNERERPPSLFENDFLSCLVGHKYLTSKCATAMKEILENGWFQGFSSIAKMKMIITLIGLLNDTATDTKTLSISIQLFGSLTEVLDDDFTNPLFSDQTDLKSQLHSKYQDHCNDTLLDNFQSSCESLPKVLENLLLDPRWEVKDTVLELISHLVNNSKRSDSLERFLEKEQFWLKSWTLLDTDESYVRAATVRLIGLVQENSKLRDVMFVSLPMEEVHTKLFHLFEEDDEAFPKRSIIDAIYRWIDLTQLRRYLLDNIAFARIDQMVTYESKVWDFILKVLKKAPLNFDWEVKMKGILCWEKILKIGSEGDQALDGEELECDKDAFRRGIKCLGIVCAQQGSRILVQALNDCDKLVCDAALKTLTWIKNNCIAEQHNKHAADITSCFDIKMCDIDFSSSDSFLIFLKRIDFEELARSMRLADDKVVNNPISLLNDIIAAAQHNDDNLLDCY